MHGNEKQRQGSVTEQSGTVRQHQPSDLHRFMVTPQSLGVVSRLSLYLEFHFVFLMPTLSYSVRDRLGLSTIRGFVDVGLPL
jgi:hypothetical protein